MEDAVLAVFAYFVALLCIAAAGLHADRPLIDLGFCALAVAILFPVMRWSHKKIRGE